jgi:hypothetical protein
VSFDLGVLDFDEVPSHVEVTARYAVLCEGTDDGMARSARVDAFIAECLARWPGDTDADFESSPWASWPLETQRTAAGLVANIVWARAEELKAAWAEMAERHGLVLYDPQADELVLPDRMRSSNRPSISGHQSRWRRRK